MGIRTTDPELLLMNQLERILRKQPPMVRENVINWLSAKNWPLDVPAADPRQLVIPGAGKSAAKAAE